ncbi:MULTISPECIES: acyltransferase [unclassified Bradyrhizobium]|uniref:acyltransferase family protein n=1 Tax=unclassified Bradyrhizobium TaxID=2631580 RepID=UPI00339299F2
MVDPGQPKFSNGFDYLRIVLALGVLSFHSMEICDDKAAMAFAFGPLGPFVAMLLLMFFSLSGYLVAGSLDRSKTIEGFLTLRALRIAPALAVEVLLSALILGPVLTVIPLSQYFTSPVTLSYLLNTLGYIHFHLPGVFVNNPHSDVINNSLWTVPYELDCYVAITVCAAIGLIKYPRLFALGFTLLWIGMWGGHLIWTHGAGLPRGIMPGELLVVSFLAGILLQICGPWIIRSAWVALICIFLCYVLLRFNQTKMLSVLPAAYLTIWLGLLDPQRIPILLDGDYSYGVYLFGYPIQQALASYSVTASWYVNLPIAVCLSLAYAVFSWHCVEQPILFNKKAAVERAERVGRAVRRQLAPTISLLVRVMMRKRATPFDH